MSNVEFQNSTPTARRLVYITGRLAATVQGARAGGVGSRGCWKMLHLHWMLTHPRLHHPVSLAGVARQQPTA